jgi:predicted ferric reductase
MEQPMPNNNSNPQPKQQSVFQPLVFILVGAAILFFYIFLLPTWLPSLMSSMTGPDPKAYWFLSRATAIVGYLLLCLSMAMGLLMSGKLAGGLWGIPITTDLHRFVSLMGIGLSLIHGLLLLGDKYMAYSLIQVLLPFASGKYLPFWVGLGQLSFYLWALVIITSYLRKKTGRKVWRAFHFISYAVLIMALLHGITTGTDSEKGWAFYMYWISAGVLIFLTVYRILVGRFGQVKASQAAKE